LAAHSWVSVIAAAPRAASESRKSPDVTQSKQSLTVDRVGSSIKKFGPRLYPARDPNEQMMTGMLYATI